MGAAGEGDGGGCQETRARESVIFLGGRLQGTAGIRFDYLLPKSESKSPQKEENVRSMKIWKRIKLPLPG